MALKPFQPNGTLISFISGFGWSNALEGRGLFTLMFKLKTHLVTSSVLSSSDIRSTQGFSIPSSGRVNPAACPHTWTLCPRGSARQATPPTWLASGTWASTGELSSQVSAWSYISLWEMMPNSAEVKPVLCRDIMSSGFPPQGGALMPTWR